MLRGGFHAIRFDLQRVENLRRRSNFEFFQNVQVDFNLILRFSDSSDGSGGLVEVFYFKAE